MGKGWCGSNHGWVGGGGGQGGGWVGGGWGRGWWEFSGRVGVVEVQVWVGRGWWVGRGGWVQEVGG